MSLHPNIRLFASGWTKLLLLLLSLLNQRSKLTVAPLQCTFLTTGVQVTGAKGAGHQLLVSLFPRVFEDVLGPSNHMIVCNRSVYMNPHAMPFAKFQTTT
jgi:hypothetical protein